MNFDNNDKNVKNIFEKKDDSFDEDISHGEIVIKEFLRNLMDTPFNITELLFQFEFFLLNRDNEENDSKSKFKWYFLTEKEIKIFFNGFYCKISHSKINGFLFHCGNITKNKIAADQCLEFLKKLLSDDYNPQADSFLKITNSVRIDAYFVLYKYIEDKNNYESDVKKILGNDKAEEMFVQWIDVEF